MLTLTITTETYSRTESGKSWKSKPDETTTETLPWEPTPERVGDVARSGEEMHRKITEADTLRWFRRIGGSEHAVRCYTPVGYIVTRLTSTSPDRTVRIVRKFRIADVPADMATLTPGDRVRLIVDVWHGMVWEAGTELTISRIREQPQSYWLTDDAGQTVNVWPWEIELI